jgi:peptidoglycan/LPS O-acetylase OafA/YrhL
MTYYKQLDGLRFFAILAVMISHWLEKSIPIDLLKNLPYSSGVSMFFVLSGFLITKIILEFRQYNEENNIGHGHFIKAFHMRRTLRIFPVYYLTIIVLAILNFSNCRELFPWLISFTSNFKMTLANDYFWPFTHFWALAVEEQFYIIWVILMVFIPKRYLKNTIILSIVLSLIIRFYLMFYTKYWLGSTVLVFTNMHSLGLGALISYYVVFHRQKFFTSKIQPYVITLIGLIILFFVVYVIFNLKGDLMIYKRFREPYMVMIYSLVVFLVIRTGFKGFFRFLLENKFVVYLGKISYGLYIYHVFAISVWIRLNKYVFKLEANPFETFVYLFIISLLMATISWYCIEKPINNLKKYFKYTKDVSKDKI